MHIILTKKNAHDNVFYLAKYSCKNTIFICLFFLKWQWESWDKNKKKSAIEKRKIPRVRKGTSIFSFSFFLYFSSFSLSSSLLHNTTKARAIFWGFVRLKRTKVGGWNEKQGQNDVILACFYFILFYFKRTNSKTTSFWLVLFKIRRVKMISF